MAPQHGESAAGADAIDAATANASPSSSPAPSCNEKAVRSAVFRYAPPPFFDARSSRVPRWLQRALADVFMFVVYHYNLWAVPALAFFYALYQVLCFHCRL